MLCGCCSTVFNTMSKLYYHLNASGMQYRWSTIPNYDRMTFDVNRYADAYVNLTDNNRNPTQAVTGMINTIQSTYVITTQPSVTSTRLPHVIATRTNGAYV